MRILVVEDEPDLASALARGLRQRAYAVDVAATYADADLRVRSTDYDLVVLDWMLPDGTGLELLAALKRGEIPVFGERVPKVLMLTARDEIDDRVAGLDAGADDYLVKPFAFSELEARVRALLRRDRSGPPDLRVADVVLDPVRFTAARGDRDLGLTAKEFALLEFLMSHQGEVLSQEELLEHVWDEMADPFTNTVRVTLSNLRKKLGEPPVIETVPGRGYRLGG